MAFVPDGHCLWKCGAIPTRAGVIVAETHATINSDNAHSGTYCLKVSLSDWYYRLLPIARADLYSSQWLYPGEGAHQIAFFVNDVQIASIRREDEDDVYWDAYVDDVKVAAGTVAAGKETYQRLSIHIVTGAEGSITTRVDGIPDISYNGAVGSGSIDEIGFFGKSDMLVDDWIFGTGGWPGDCGVEFIAGSRDVSTAWLPSAGSDNYALVDERPPSDDDYVSTTADATDVYGMADWDNDLGAKIPLMVTGIVRVKKSDAGSDDKITLGFGDGVNTADGSAVSVLTSYEYRWHSSNAAPDGGAWTDDDVDNLQLRVIGDIA